MQDVINDTGLCVDKLVSLTDMIGFVQSAHRALSQGVADFKRTHAPDRKAQAEAKSFQEGMDAMRNAIMKGLLDVQQRQPADNKKGE